MRFVRIFLTFILIFITFIGGMYVVLREGMLWWSAQQVKNDVAFLMRTNQWQNLQSQCYLENSPSAAKQMQLRFLNRSEYVLELGCDNYRNVEIQKRTLPVTVQKTTGTAGFIYDLSTQQLTGAITLKLWDQTRVVQAANDTVVSSWGETAVMSDSLITSCEAHGFQCCDAVLEQGQGDLFRNGVNDCQEQCYSSCVQRPNLVLFQTDPLLDPVARTVEVSKSVPTVFFRYTFGNGSAPLRAVTISYGDGTEESASELSGEFVKQYDCQQERCTYRAQIQAIDESGVPSTITRIAEVDVLLVPEE